MDLKSEAGPGRFRASLAIALPMHYFINDSAAAWKEIIVTSELMTPTRTPSAQPWLSNPPTIKNKCPWIITLSDALILLLMYEK
jgi:hypothetical protein